MPLLDARAWAVWVAITVLVATGIAQLRKRRVPNSLTYPAAVLAWLAGAAVSLCPAVPSYGGGILSSLAAMVAVTAAMVILWQGGFAGGGCVKAQMAFGAWVGVALEWRPAALLATGATLVGAAVAWTCYALHRRRAKQGRWDYGQEFLSAGAVAAVVAGALWLELI